MTMLVKKQFVVINYIFLTIVFLFCFFATNFIVFGQEDETKIVAEDFLKHIFSNEPHFKLLNGYCLSDELQKSLTANGACEFWNKTLEHEYGILGNYKKVEVMNYQGNNRHVYFYYKGSKQNVKFWVTFHGNEITGFYWEPWVDPIIPVSLNPVSSKLSHPIFIVIMFVSLFTIVVLEIYFGEKWRAYFIQKKQKSVPVFYNNNKETYRESQNPFWFYLLWGTSLFFVFFSFSIYYIFYGLSSIDFNSFFILVSIFITIFLVFFIPLCLFGLYIEVNNICLVIRLGLFRRCILQINIDDIISVEKTNFNALRDFGGWGIRLGKAGVMGYFNMSGNKGVVVTTHAGKKYILGSDNPNHLAHVIAIRIKTLETLH
ncbi:MAG: hypothetical protein LBL62_04465 [Planctomycetaceae bacterium]|jgi:hypothetical protein|nr:hypothetical protein [Planctomycetaceae bacterium]